jgi:hypothetical protein
VYGEEPDCSACLPHITAEDAVVLKIYLIIKDIIFQFPSEAFHVIERYLSDTDEQERCFNLVRAIEYTQREEKTTWQRSVAH